MAIHGLLTLLDDVASLLDDVSAMTKVAAKKTAGVVGDDLALNAEQVTGFGPERELPVVWRVAKGSLVNKAILVPSALLISAFLPGAILPLLMIGGAYLCFEGFEKLVHKMLLRAEKADRRAQPAVDGPLVPISHEGLIALENDRIKGAIRTDFILSAEIIVIALGVIAGERLLAQVATLTTVAVLITVVVYGLVGMIVKLDDVGLALIAHGSGPSAMFGRGLVWVAPRFMKVLTIVGTAAMFLVGGGILVHGIPPLAHFAHGLEAGPAGSAAASAFGGVMGVVAGALLVAVFLLGKRIFRTKPLGNH